MDSIEFMTMVFDRCMSSVVEKKERKIKHKIHCMWIKSSGAKLLFFFFFLSDEKRTTHL